MSHTNKRHGHTPHQPRYRKPRLMRSQKIDEAKAADLAVNRMAAGIADENELEAILQKARPASRDQIRERLIPHLSFKVRDRIYLP